MRLLVIVAAIPGLLAATAANAASSCAALTVKVTPADRAGDAARVRRFDPGQSLTGSDVGRVMADGPWRLVWATPKNGERGVYFFHRGKTGGYRLAGTWGGVLAPDERQDALKWAAEIRGGGPPRQLARCFADVVVGGE